MDSKLIILLILILFGMIAGYMVANGMIDLVSIFSRVTKSQAQESLGGVKLEVVSPVSGVYYEAQDFDLDGDDNPDIQNAVDLGSIIKIDGKNIDDKTLTISVATSGWTLDAKYVDTGTVTDVASGKTIQATIDSDATDIVAGSYGLIITDGTNTANRLFLVRTSTEPFNMAEVVELIFAVGETAKTEVSIVVES